MQRVDRIEKRRFVGREFLLFLWFESELFDATLGAAEHGPFGLWLERCLVLCSGKESTKITAPLPGLGREAKEALLRGQLPKSAGIRIAWKGDENCFVLNAEQLSVTGLKLHTVLDQDADDASSASLDELQATMAQVGRKGRKSRKPAASHAADDESYEVFYERMRLTEEFEALLVALYRDFITLRLGLGFTELIVPALRCWARGSVVDAEAYRVARGAWLKGAGRRTPTVASASA
jgi:hypothetical protein